MAISPPKKRLILISLSATNLETRTEVALLILITRHLFCFTDRLRLTQVIKSNRKRLCLLDFRELSSRTTQIHRERTTSGTPKEMLTWISFPSWLGCLESINLWSWSARTHSHSLLCSWNLQRSHHSTVMPSCRVVAVMQMPAPLPLYPPAYSC